MALVFGFEGVSGFCRTPAEELDAELCCMVSPVFLVNYMGSPGLHEAGLVYSGSCQGFQFKLP